jgi:HSP20 family protein
MALPVRRRETTPQRVARWEPFRELEQLQEATAQLLGRMWAGVGTADSPVWSPLVDIEESEDAGAVETELPGVGPKDVSVQYRVTLPGATDPEGVEARLADGVLTVRVPAQARPQRIEVKNGNGAQ